MLTRPDTDERHALPPARGSASARLRTVTLVVVGIGLYALCLHIAEVSPSRLWAGLPRLWAWTARAWPPDFSELPTLLARAAETVAMATVGTSFGAAISVPLCLVAARNVSATPLAYHPARLLLNTLRGIDSFIFALILVAAVGLGPFAGVLGIALHTAGSIAKLWSETLEAVEPGPIEAAVMSGAGRIKVAAHALLPDALPQLTSTLLYMWEFNVRSSTVLGIVGAGGIGQELKNSVDLLAFDRVAAIVLVILAMVTAIDAMSAWARRRLL